MDTHIDDKAPLSSSCGFCSKPAKLSCSRCSKTRYCSKECQRTAWKLHKPLCNSVSLTPSFSRDELPPLPRLVRRSSTTLPILVLPTSSPSTLQLSGVLPSHRHDITKTLPLLAKILEDDRPTSSSSSSSSAPPIPSHPLLHLKLTNLILTQHSQDLSIFLQTLPQPGKLQTLAIEFADSFDAFEPNQDVSYLKGNLLRMGWTGAMLGSLVLPFFDAKRMREAGLRLKELIIRVRDERLREDFEEGVVQLMEDHPGDGMRVSVEGM